MICVCCKQIPNGLGLLFCISQFILYGCYYSSHPDGRVIPPTRRRPSDEGGFDAMPSKDFTILHNNIRVIRSSKVTQLIKGARMASFRDNKLGHQTCNWE